MFNISKYKQQILKVWQISWPLIVANSFWNFQVTIDRMFLGQYSTESLGAAIATIAFFWAPMALVHQTAAYVTTFVAQYLGSKQEEWVGPSFWTSIYTGLIGGLLFLLLIPLAPTIFGLMGHSGRLQALEVDYFQALAYSALPTALVAACSGYFTGIGNSRWIMLINGAGLILNVGLDYILIFGKFGVPAMGIFGAGLATACANLGAALLGFYLVFTSSDRVRYNLPQGWKFNPELFWRFLKFGVPSGLQWSMEGLAFATFIAFIGNLPNGDSALAASSITFTIMMLAIHPVLGLAQGVSALVGQSLGEDDPATATQVSWVGVAMGLFYVGLMGLSFLVFPNFYLNLFGTKTDSAIWIDVQTMVPYLLMFVAFFLLFDCVNLVLSFTLKGAGDTRFVSIVALLLPWPLMVLPTYVMLGWPNGVYWAWGAASFFICVQGTVFLLRFLQGRWKSMRVI